MNPRAPLAAMALLTVVPMPALGARPFAGAVAAFPLVGALLGVAIALLDAALRLALPASVVTAVDLAALAVLTGAIHLDGVADTADGLASRGDAAARLAAMRDSRIGAFGAAALALVLIAEYSALSSVPDAARGPAIVGALTLSRYAMSLSGWAGPPARADGAGAAFARDAKTADVLIATLFTGVFIGVIASAPLLATAVTLAVTAGIARFAADRIGGLTGDVHGAIGELIFACALVLSSARAP